MVYNTTQHPPPPPTHCLCILYVYFAKGGEDWREGQREGRGATVQKRGQKYQQVQHDWLYLQSINSISINQ